jgi:c-di-GMP-binding flagellar brake protein YcgR
MDPSKFLNFGERIDVEIEGKQYKSDVQDIGPSDVISISQPMLRQTPVFIPPHTEMKIVYYRPNGMYEFPAIIIGTADSDSLRMIRLQALADPQKYQRRMNFRVPLKIPVSAVITSELTHTARTVYSFHTQSIDLSEGGMGLYAPQSYPLAARMRVEFSIILEEADEQLSLMSDVARCTWPQKLDEQFVVGVKFSDISEKTQRLLSKYIIQEQIRMRKRVVRDPVF